MRYIYLICVLIIVGIPNYWAQCDLPSISVSNSDCSNIAPTDIISGGGVNNGEVKYLVANTLTSNLSVGTGGVLYVCGEINLSIGSGPNLISLNGGTLVISSCATVNLNSGGFPTYINSGSEIINYGTLNITQSGTYIRLDNGAKLFNYGALNAEGIIFLKDGSIINDNMNNHSYIEAITMRMGSGGAAQYASASSKLCLAENSCLENNVLVNGTGSNWLEYGGGTDGAYLYGTTNLTGNGGSISADPELQVCTTDNDFRWGSATTSLVSDINSCTGCMPIAPCLIALPIELIDVSVTQNLDGVELNWATLFEKDNDRFEIQRLANIWETIGTVKGNGTTTEKSDYSFADYSPMVGMNYYRLKQYDTDGRIDYSMVKAIFVNPFEILVSPNPSSGEFKVQFPETTKEAIVEIRDLKGRLVYQKDEKSNGIIKIDLSDYSGVFILSVITGDTHFKKRILIQ